MAQVPKQVQWELTWLKGKKTKTINFTMLPNCPKTAINFGTLSQEDAKSDKLSYKNVYVHHSVYVFLFY